MGTERMENQMEEEIWLVEYKDHFTHLLTEAPLSGTSRSLGIPNWYSYISNDFDKDKDHHIE